MMWCCLALLMVGSIYGKSLPPEEIGNDYLFQGDMLMRKHMYNIAMNGGDVDRQALQKAGRSGDPKVGQAGFGMNTMKWENGIVPYVLHSKTKCKWYMLCSIFGSAGRPERAIRSAMREWEEKTKRKSGKYCIKFVPRTNERDYVLFTNNGWGKCYSHVGRVTGRQVISLTNGCSKHGIALHEIGHALGLHHEQSRPDRDDYVTVKTGNIKKGALNNFKKYSFSQINRLGSPYDYGSIMHYPKGAFGKWPWSKTLIPKKNVQIGQRDHLSRIDAETMKKYYGCFD